jgi:DNA repair protein RecN (Recombination protein N)
MVTVTIFPCYVGLVLVELLVENFAVIERVRVRFHPGFNVLTGETGSGKSMIVDALALLFGGRASADMVRSDTVRARITGIFEIPNEANLRRVLEAAGIELEDDELLLEREILSSGKSRAFAASRPVTAALLRDLAPFLGDIHGQHDQQLLFSADAQRDMLDAFASIDTTRTAELFQQWRAVSAQLEELEKSEQESLRLADLWNFQRKEIEAASLKPGEDVELENESRVLKNVARLQESANAAYSALYDSAESVYAQLKIAMRKLDELTRIDQSLAGVAETLKPAAITVDEVSYTLRDYLGRLEADPLRLEAVETRLAGIDKLKRKYGASIEEILTFFTEVREQLSRVENASEHRAELERQRAKLAAEYESSAASVSSARRKAGSELARRVQVELAALAMKGTVLEVAVEPAPWSDSGCDRIEYRISPNVGEEPRPLEKVASGGELSRIALALKTCTTASQKTKGAPRTLVFDEVDAGVGGGAAEAVGKRLKKLSTSGQVLCVTHLAQIAGFGDHHYSVEKREVKGRTVAEFQELSGEERTQEIGRMLSGSRVTPEALKHAEQLIKAGAS